MQISAELRAARVISLNKISRHLIKHIYICRTRFISLDPKALLKCSRMLKLKNVFEVLILPFSQMYHTDIHAIILTSKQWKSEVSQSITSSNHLSELIHPGPDHESFMYVFSKFLLQYSHKSLRWKKYLKQAFFKVASFCIELEGHNCPLWTSFATLLKCVLQKSLFPTVS